MTAFADIVHHIATVGEHVIEIVDGQQTLKLNGAVVTGEELVQLVATLGEAATRLGLTL